MAAPEANGSSAPSVIRGIRFGKNSISTLHDLELALNAAVHVNQHLNLEIEAALQQLQRAEQERLAWEQHARSLALQLARHKRAAAVAAAAAADGGSAATAEDAGKSPLCLNFKPCANVSSPGLNRSMQLLYVSQSQADWPA